MIDLDAHRRILAWGLASGRICTAEYNLLMRAIQEAEWMQSECSGKAAFQEFAFANKIAQKSAFRHDAGMRPYKCVHCGLWHIGSKRPEVSRTFRRSVEQ